MRNASRRAFIAMLAACAVPVRAQQRGPAFPAEVLSSLARWDDTAFLSGWRLPDPSARLACRAWPGPCALFGVNAHGASAYFEDGRLRSISLLFLDGGAWFGFADAGAASKVPEFQALHARIASSVEQGAVGLGARFRDVAMGGKTLIKHTARVSKIGDVWSRLVVWPDHFVKLTLFRDEDAATQLLAPYRRTLKRDDQTRLFSALVREGENGDRAISGIPLLQQGNRAYCGMSALAMTMQHLGLRIETEELAAAAGIRFGTTRDARTRETYDAAGTVGAVRIERSQRFDFAKARDSIVMGMPVIVFRHWNSERDFIHSTFQRRFAGDPTATLPKADMGDRKLWPQRGGYAHASIVNGFNRERGEVIFTESWSEQARDRRMRIEEMEGTSYMACYPRLA